MATAADVAKWMVAQLGKSGGMIYQAEVAADIEQKFGEEHVVVNDDGGFSISKAVLTEFRALTEETVVWDRTERAWRLRESTDHPTRRQAE